MAELLAEKLIPLDEIAKIVPGRPHKSTLHRWRMRGVRGIQLETVLIGGKWFSSREAVNRFFIATTAAAMHRPVEGLTSHSKPPTDGDAEAALDRAGL